MSEFVPAVILPAAIGSVFLIAAVLVWKAVEIIQRRLGGDARQDKYSVSDD